MDRFNIKLTATIACITFYALREPTKTVNIGNAVSGLQDLLTSSEYRLSGSYDFLTPEMITYCTGITDTGVLNQILAIWHEVPATNAQTSQIPESSTYEFYLTLMKRLPTHVKSAERLFSLEAPHSDLYEALKKLVPAQFAVLELFLGVPTGERTPDAMPLPNRAVILLRYLNTQTGGLDMLREELARSHPGLLKR